ncbi:MAG TPA: PQQ-binding-like beta-propeller repeat protein [Stellaceae bacterium]|nr:PQQ-binding-like beta-propeller repeat protein [Stellaceae bacterium]
MRAIAAALILCLIPLGARGEGASAVDGASVYRERCAQCHEGGVARAPDAASLKRMSPTAVKLALTGGSMRTQGESLSAAEIDAVSRFVGGAETTATSAAAATCAKTAPPASDPFSTPHWNGWGVDLTQHRFQPAAMAGLAAADVPKLKLKWAFGLGEVTRANAQPTVVGDRLFLGSVNGRVYALDAKSGCVLWVFAADGPVRSAITIGIDTRSWTAYFGDQRANAYAVDALTGELRWKTHVEAHRAAMISGAPVLVDDTLYVPVSSLEEVIGANVTYSCCTFRGSIVALDARSGAQRWKTYTIAEEPQPVRKNEIGVELFGPSGAGVWNSPAVDRARAMLYLGTGDSYSDPPADTSDAILALRLENGALVWKQQMTPGDAFTVACGGSAPGKGNCPQAGGPDLDFGASPILVTLGNGKRALIAAQKSGVVHALDPENGAILWQRTIGRGGTLGGIQWGAAADERKVYVALSDIRIRRVSEGTPGAQPGFGTTFLLDPRVGGGLYALSLETGEVVWHTPHPGCGETPGCSPAQSAAVTAIPGVVFSGGLDGHLRAYDVGDGRIVWDVDTKGSYETVNGMTARGGSIDGPGPVVVGGMLYVSSGYAVFGGMPGNVLLAFSVGGS